VEKYWKELKKKPNVIGYSATLKPRVRGGVELPDELCWRIYVEKKVPEAELSAEDLLPKILEGVPIDVYSIGKIKALDVDKKSRIRPLRAGASTMHWTGTACTLNGFYYDTKTSKVLMAGNNHCFALENSSSIGDPILQPSPSDGGKIETDIVGKLSSFVPIKFEEFQCPYRNFFFSLFKLFFRRQELANKVDIAFAEIVNGVGFDLSIIDMGTAYGTALPKVGDLVQKSGRTSCRTTDGKIIDLEWHGNVQYSRGVAVFEDCILIEKSGFSAGGDSGSPIITQETEPKYVGALFAGSETHTIACKVNNIENLTGYKYYFKKEEG